MTSRGHSRDVGLIRPSTHRKRAEIVNPFRPERITGEYYFRCYRWRGVEIERDLGPFASEIDPSRSHRRRARSSRSLDTFSRDTGYIMH